MIISDDGIRFSFKITEKVQSIFESMRVFSSSGRGNPPRWKIGDAITAAKTYCVQPYIAIYTGNTINRMGSFSYTRSSFLPWIQVGRYCSIGGGVRTMGMYHRTDTVSSHDVVCNPTNRFAQAFDDWGVPDWEYQPNPQKKQPIIGNDVWIGDDVMLALGITLGDGCVVGAGSVVTKDVPPYAIVGGAPAKIIRYRFPPRMIAQLHALSWWDYALPDFARLKISMRDPGEFVERLSGAVGSGEISPYHPKTETLFDIIQGSTA